MPIFVVFIIVSLALYVFFKVKSLRTRLPMEKKWISSKSSMALGSFITFFGINQLFLFQSMVTYIVAGIFIVIGSINLIGGYKMYKFYLPYAIDEAEAIVQQKG
ncbi:YtpI family protein [Bacillus sp. JJ634]